VSEHRADGYHQDHYRRRNANEPTGVIANRVIDDEAQDQQKTSQQEESPFCY
jgi:hypothetical protein